MSASFEHDVKYARIRLKFREPKDSCWFLVNYKKMKYISNVIDEIKYHYFSNSEVKVTLTLQECILPSWERSLLIRDSDVVCVDVKELETAETDASSVQSSSKSKKKSKKRKHEDIDEGNDVTVDIPTDNMKIVSLKCNDVSEEVKSKSKKKKKKKSPDLSQLEECVAAVETDLGLSTTKRQKLETSPDVVNDKGDSSKSKEERAAALSAVDDNSYQEEKKDLEDGAEDKIVFQEQKKKRKRKRHRKRKTNASNSFGDNRSQGGWTGNSTEEHSYRRGGQMEKYANLQPYRPPRWEETNNNNHVKFQSDSNSSSSSSSSDSEQDTNKDRVVKDKTEMDTDRDTFHDKYMENESSTPIETGVRDKYWLSYDGDPSCIESDSRPGSGFSNGPSPLVTSQLPNGVPVFTRPRRRGIPPRGGFRELTKEEQLNTVATNRSVVLMNTSNGISHDALEEENKEREYSSDIGTRLKAFALGKDYSSCTLLSCPPREGDMIAYKILEVSENYTPEVSNYKEAKVISHDPITQKVRLLKQTKEKDCSEPRKFDVTVEDEDSLLTNVTEEETEITLAWSSLLEPRLVT